MIPTLPIGLWSPLIITGKISLEVYRLPPATLTISGRGRLSEGIT